jgi:hypothetical protein
MEGLGDLLPIYSMTQSLGLLSTLVLSTAVGSLIYWERANFAIYAGDPSTLFLVLANAFSTYTVAYCICECYYIQALHHAAIRQATKAKKLYAKQGTETLSRGQTMELGFGYEEMSSPEESHDRFVGEVTAAFRGFNGMRQMARNAMWLSLFCLISSVASDMIIPPPLPGTPPKLAAESVSGGEPDWSARAAAAIFGLITVLLSMASPTPAMRKIAVVFFVFFLACVADMLRDKDAHRPMLRIMCWVILFGTMIQVGATVFMFRREFGEQVSSHAEVY